MLTQVHPEQGGDLVVAGAARPQPAADIRAGPLDETALERGVDVLVAVLGHERPALDVDPQPVERVEHRLEGGVVEQARPVQDPGVGAGPARSCSASRQSKCVDFDSAARASAGPPAKRPPHRAVLAPCAGWDGSDRLVESAPAADWLVGSVTGGPFGCRP